jgi:N utilization substance protein B
MINRRLLRIKVIQAFYSHLLVNDKYDIASATKELNRHIFHFHHLYLFLLDLLNEIKKYAEKKYEIELNKFIQNKGSEAAYLRLIENKAINKFSLSTAFANYKKNYGFSWANHQDFVKEVTTSFVNSEIFQKYSQQENNFENDKELIFKFYNEFLKEQYPDIYPEMEEMNIYWADVTDYALSNCAKTILQIQENTAGENVKIFPMYKQEEDRDFAVHLLQYTITNQENLFEHIKPFLTQWEFERLFKLDMIILQLATAEFLEFPTIPILATVDEYVEISKEYCTEKSWSFINGVLDRISHHLCEKGLITKVKDGCQKILKQESEDK